MSDKQVQVITLDSILDEQSQTFSQVSMPVSFNLKDVENEKMDEQQVTNDYSDFFQQQDDSVSISLTKKSQTTKTVSKLNHLRYLSVFVKDDSVKKFVLKQTPLDDKIFTKNVTFMNIANVSKPFEVSNRLVGLPTSIFASSSKFLAIGTSQSSVVLFEMGVKNYRLMETVNKNRYGSTNTIAIAKDNIYMACGYKNGYITIWDLTNFSLVKTIQSETNDESILKIQFVKNNQFISSDIQGNVMIHTIQKYVWTSIKSKRLITKSPSAVYYDIRPLKLLNGRPSAALVSYSSVLIITIEPIQAIYKFERPESVPDSIMPIADIGLFRNGQTQQNHVLISWATKLYIYLFNPLSRTQYFELKSVYDHGLHLLSIQIMSPTSFILLDTTGSYRIVSLISYLQNQENIVKSEGILKNDLVVGKCTIEDNKHKNTANTVCKTIQHFNQIFFITEGGMFRCRFHKWTQMIYYLIQNKEYLQALKCAIEIFNGRIDIFSQKVIISPKTMLLFNDMITYYLSMRLKQIKTLSESEIKQIIMTSIEFCIQIKSYDHLFTKVFGFIDKSYHLQKQFIQSLEIFIRSFTIKRIPNFALLEKIINYYAQEDPSLVDTLILSLDPHSIDYFSTLDVCVTHKLYRSLIYISELNNDFVSPANKILQNCIKTRDNGSTQMIQQNTSLLYLQILKLLQGKTIADTSLSSNSIKIGLSTLSLWFLIEQNARQLVNFNGAMYFQIIEKIITNQVVAQTLEQNTPAQFRQKLFNSLRGIVAGYQQYQQGLSSIIIRINQRWPITQQMIEYSIKYLKLPNPHVYKLIDKNSKYINQLLIKDPKISNSLSKQLKALVLLNNKKYQEALNLYQQVSDQDLNILFCRLNEELIINHMEKLVNLDPDATAVYIHQHNYSMTAINQLFSKISPNGNAYLFIRKLKRLDRFKQLIWKKQIQLFYLQSLCKFKNENRILFELQKTNEYSSIYYQEAMSIIKKYKLKQCQAYMLKPQASISLYKQVYVMRFANQLQKLIYYKYSNASDYLRIINSIFKVLESIPSHLLQFFGFILKQFTLPSKKKNYGTIGKQIEQIAEKKVMKDNQFILAIKSMIQTFFTKCSIIQKGQMTAFIETNHEILSLKFIMVSVIKALTKFTLNTEIFDNINSIVKNDDIHMFDKLLEAKASTFFCKPKCRSCLLFLTDGISTSVLFSCGHCFHSQCLLSPQLCPICNTNMFLKKSERRPTVLLQQSTFKNKSVSLVNANPMYSYISFDEMIESQVQDDWRMPNIRSDD